METEGDLMRLNILIKILNEVQHPHTREATFWGPFFAIHNHAII